jgi:hypothetical protein
MSLKVQPAPRISSAPIPKATNSHASSAPRHAMAMLHQHGNSSSQAPMGRS